MSKYLVALTLSWLLGSVAHAGPAPTVTVEEYAELVVVYVHDLDRLQTAYSALSAEVRLAGIETTYRIDLVADYQTPAILIRKAKPAACGKVTLILRNGDNELLRRDYATKVALQVPAAVPLSGATAFIERGGVTGESPVIVQPDIAKLPSTELAEATRTVDMNAVAARVESDTNFPLVSSNNNCAISRQTAYPDDPQRRSCYIPLKSQIYDPSTGAPLRAAHYLAEVPLNPDWLGGTQDAVIHVDADEIRIHTPDKSWPPGSPTAQLLTGEGAAGLGQGAGCMTVDDDGNLYYCSEMAAEVVRFNVRKAEWEAPPIQFVEAINTLLPKREELPENFRKEGIRWDVHRHVIVGGGRLFIIPLRNAVYGKVYCNGVISFPLAHWDDAEKFRAGMRLVACSWPGTPVSLYDSWPKPREAARTIEPGVYHDSRYWLGGYSGSAGGPWGIELNADGAGVRTVAATAADVNQALRAISPPLLRNAPGFINWWDYGVLTMGRAELSQLLTGTRNTQATDTVQVYYDAIAAMRRAPERYSLILENLQGPSLAPSYMAVEVPQRPGHLLGVGEYGYQLADLDFTGVAKGVVTKRYLSFDNGAARSPLPVKIGLGPYGRLWRREDDRQFLLMTGYTGVAQMLYSVGNKPLERFDAELLRLHERSLDGSPAGGFKWYQFPVAGIDGRVFLTGNHQADRGGHPYANGLMAFSPERPLEAVRLAQMTRACSTRYLRTRLLYDPDGRKRQEFVLVGGMSLEAYIQLLNGVNLPQNRDAKLFFYECVEGEEPKALFGASLPVVAGKSGADCQVLSRDRRHLVTLQQGCILTFDLAAKRYVDGHRMDAEVWRFSKPDFKFTVAPDDRIFLCVQPQDAARATFYEVDVSARGAVALKPYLTITGSTAEAVKSLNGTALAFVSDPQGDGSYDLCIAADWRAPSTTLHLIPDFLPPRP